MANTQNLSEVIRAAFEVISVAKEVGSDGLSFEDVGTVVTDPELRDALTKAVEGAPEIATELADLDMSEVLDVVNLVVTEFKRVF